MIRLNQLHVRKNFTDTIKITAVDSTQIGKLIISFLSSFQEPTLIQSKLVFERLVVRRILSNDQSLVRKYRFRRKLDISLYEVKDIVEESEED